MATRLSCWIGRHIWVTRVEQGESYKVCSACGKPPRGIKGEHDINDAAEANKAREAESSAGM